MLVRPRGFIIFADEFVSFWHVKIVSLVSLGFLKAVAAAMQFVDTTTNRI